MSRDPGWVQGLTLVAMAWVATIAAVVLAPALPQMLQHFKSVSHVALKISLVATGPSLLVGLSAIPMGVLVDGIGRRRMLIAALLFYALIGMAPLVLDSLDGIVASRIVLGIAESAIMTAGTALIGDYFKGRARDRWLAAQTGVAPLTAVLLVGIGGYLGGFGWRTPFYVYAFGWVQLVLAMLFLWEPVRQKSANDDPVVPMVAPFRWAKSLWISLAVVLSMIMFVVTVIQFGFLVSERGMTLPRDIGLWSALVTVATPLGSMLFGLHRGGTHRKLSIAYALLAAGFFCMSLVPTVGAAIVGACIANLGGGFLLPTAITWLLSSMPASLVGRGSGLWTASSFLGQFLGPVAIIGLTVVTHSLSHAVLVCAVVCTIVATVASACRLVLPRGA